MSAVKLGNRLHAFARPAAREALQFFYGKLLGCNVRELDLGMPHPILLVTTAEGTFSIEFCDDAPDPALPWRGAWMEFVSDDAAMLEARLRDAGVPEFRHPGSPHAYFSAPNGQVIRLVTEAALASR